MEAFTYTDPDGNVRDQTGRIADPADPLGQVVPLAEARAQVAERLICENGLRNPVANWPQVGDGDPGDGGEQQTAIDRRYLELRGRLLDAKGLLTIPAPVPIVEGLLFRDSLAWLAGKPGHGKSFVAVDLACCVGTGTPWHDRQVTRGKVLYLIAEGAAGLGQRVNAWSVRTGRRVEQVLFLPVPLKLAAAGVDTAAFTHLLGALRPDLAILDTQARVTVGAEENSARDMGMFVDALEQVRRDSGACILVVHHDARAGENLRGSTAIEGAATTILRAAKDGQLVTISNPKQKDAPELDPFVLVLTPLAGSAVLSNEGIGLDHLTRSSEDRLLTVLDTCFGQNGATKTELGAIQDGVTVPISGYNHASWQPGNLPVGKATIRSLPDRAEADAQFFMNTINGADTFTTLKELGGSQWSYGFDVVDSEFGDFQGKRARFLKKLTVHELSPVLLAASIGTGTANIRSASAARIDDVGKRLVAAIAAKHGYVWGEGPELRSQFQREYLRMVARKVGA